LSDGKIIFDRAPGTYIASESGTLRITKLDNAGETVWSRVYPNFYTQHIISFMPRIVTADGGFIAVVEPEKNGWRSGVRWSTYGSLVKFDANGDVLWETIHYRGTNDIDIISEGSDGKIYTYGYSFPGDISAEQRTFLQIFSKDGELILSKTDSDIGWFQNAHYQNGSGWIISSPQKIICFDSNLDIIWQVNIRSVDAVASFFEDAIYWGGGGQSWQGAPLHKVSYDGEIIWTKEFNGITIPLRGGIALVLAEGEGARGITLVDMESEEILREIEQLNNWDFRIINTTPQQFTLEYFNNFSSHNSTIHIQVTYDAKGNILRQE